MDIIPKLSLNKHPKDCDNLSLVNALNVKISNDESCITNEESIVENVFIDNYLTKFYGANTYNIIAIIPCNVELVLICINESKNAEADIFRYHENTKTHVKQMIHAYGDKYKLKYHGGKIKGTFTYNVEDSLIISIAEYDCDEKVPLRTINLGNFDNTNIDNDSNIPDGLLSISPELNLPNVIHTSYVAGSAYKGWYYLFIRYKINSIDYTQWFSFGYPIYVDNIEQFQIIRYCYNRETFIDTSDPYTYGNILFADNPDDGYGAGCSDYFSNKQNIAKETFKIKFNLNESKYNKYQIGIACVSKGYTKAFKTSDIKYINNTTEYIFNSKTVVEASINEFIIDNYNYFNVKNIINYKNRLYISNYLENNLNDGNINKSIIDNIKTSLYVSYIADEGLCYDSTVISLTNIANQYDIYNQTRIPLYEYLKVNEDERISVKFESSEIINNAYNLFISCIDIDGKESNAGNLIIGHYVDAGPGLYKVEWLGSSMDTEYTISIVDDNNLGVIKLSRKKSALQSGRIYNNNSKSFNTRKSHSTLIPGEVYNFFIHFVDKYGHSTNGYRINNNIKYITEDDSITEIVPIKFKAYSDDKSVTNIYAAFPIDNDVLDGGDLLNISEIKFYRHLQNTTLTNRITDEYQVSSYTKSFIDAFKSFEDSKFRNTKWYQITNLYEVNEFDIFINNNGDKLFKVPVNETYTLDIDLNPDLSIKKRRMFHTTYGVTFNNITIPNGYVGYFISYEKFEPMQRATGLLTRSDFRSQQLLSTHELALINTANTKKSDKMLFYSSVFDISDSLKLDYNIFRIEGLNIFKKDDIPEFDYMQRNSAYNFMHDMNKPQIDSSKYNKTYAMPNYKISVGDSAADNRMGIGTCLQIDDKYNLFSTQNINDINLYKVTILNTNRNIYMSNNKTLIRLTDVKYNTNIINVTEGLNGHITFDGVIIYDNDGIALNDADKKVRAFKNNYEYYKSSVDKLNPHTFQNDRPFLAYLQFPIYSDIFFESKCYKNDPKGIVYFIHHDEKDATKNKFWGGNIVTPANSIDLFENRQGSSDMFAIKTYTNYREDLISVEQFDKTIRRSNVIQDESRINGWRIFPIEGYKNITENKGKITNLIGIGTMLLAHTEHSLFMFDTSNMLQTKDKDIQLAQPDAFDVEYKEVFTSDLGFGGLQDDKAWIIDQFGYIFYNNDFNRFYRFDAGQLNYIDDDIVEWLVKYKPNHIRFANDKDNTRLLINMNYLINIVGYNITLSYNYKSKSFVSFHSYAFDEAYNTKSKLYFKCKKHNNCSLHSFTYDLPEHTFGNFDNGASKEPTVYPSKINIIINNEYEAIKYLNYITYKLNKYSGTIRSYNPQMPVEETKNPYSGDIISIYNNLTNTGEINIAVNDEEAKNVFCNYQKPFWELGNWNFSYIRNNSDKDISAFEKSRVFGNYFIVEFTFKNTDGLKIDFETLNYNVSK